MLIYVIFSGAVTLLAYFLNRVNAGQQWSLWTRWGVSVGVEWLGSLWVPGIYDHPDILIGLAIWLLVPTWIAVEERKSAGHKSDTHGPAG